MTNPLREQKGVEGWKGGWIERTVKEGWGRAKEERGRFSGG